MLALLAWLESADRGWRLVYLSATVSGHYVALVYNRAVRATAILAAPDDVSHLLAGAQDQKGPQGPA